VLPIGHRDTWDPASGRNTPQDVILRAAVVDDGALFSYTFSY
jgi:hypothetical protein